MSRQGCVSNYVGEVLVVYPQDREIRDPDAPAYQAELKMLIAGVKHGKVLLNLENVEFVGSMMLAALFSANKQCRTSEIVLKLCNCVSYTKEVIKLSGIDRLLEIHDGEADALKSFEKKKGWFG